MLSLRPRLAFEAEFERRAIYRSAIKIVAFDRLSSQPYPRITKRQRLMALPFH